MLKINEIFPAVQGEGKSQGRRVVFLRTALCNLHCIWCDTPYTWNWTGTPFAHPVKHDYDSEVHLMNTADVVSKIESLGIKAVVISGGEPFLQQKSLFSVVKQLKEKGFWIEIETNGTVFPRPEFLQLLDQVNCSPKLSNSLDTEALRIKPQVLKALATCGKANFKFVISTQRDADEVEFLIDAYGMKDIYFMPQGRTRDEIQSASEFVQQLAKQHQVLFTTRQHILDFDNKRGV